MKAEWKDTSYQRSIQFTMQGLPSGFVVCVSYYAGKGWRINLGGGKVYESADAAKVAALKDGVKRARRASRMYAELAEALNEMEAI
jgi:hypothetical protein